MEDRTSAHVGACLEAHIQIRGAPHWRRLLASCVKETGLQGESLLLRLSRPTSETSSTHQPRVICECRSQPFCTRRSRRLSPVYLASPNCLPLYVCAWRTCESPPCIHPTIAPLYASRLVSPARSVPPRSSSRAHRAPRSHPLQVTTAALLLHRVHFPLSQKSLLRVQSRGRTSLSRYPTTSSAVRFSSPILHTCSPPLVSLIYHLG